MYTVHTAPAHVKGLEFDQQIKWLHAHNKAEKDGKDSGSSLDIANGVVGAGPSSLVGESLLAAQKDYQYVSSYEYEDRLVEPEDAGYNPVGGDNQKACSNCRFFISPARCAIVEGVIAPNGVSNLWQLDVVDPFEDALEVVIVGDTRQGAVPVNVAEKAVEQPKPPEPKAPPTPVAKPPVTTPIPTTPLTNDKEAVVSEVRVGAFKPASKVSQIIRAFADAVGIENPKPPTNGLLVTKQSDGRLRWYSRYSNSWEDRDGEIITEAAHKEYVEWANTTKAFPELWLWHTKGTKFGTADWVDYADGFAHASGLIDQGQEDVVQFLSSKELGVSHGFISAQDGKYITKYRSFEISVLPRDRAAVWTADFNLLDKEKELMAFTVARRNWLVEALGEDKVKQLESDTVQTSAQLKASGLEFKEAVAGEVAVKDTINEGMLALAQQMADITTAVKMLSDGLVSVKQQIDTKVKTTDEATEEQWVSRLETALKSSGVLRPTEGTTQQVTKEAAAAAGAAGVQESDFLTDLLTKQLGSVFGGATIEGGAAAVGAPAVGTVSIR